MHPEERHLSSCVFSSVGADCLNLMDGSWQMNQAIDYLDFWHYLILIQLHFLKVWKCCSCRVCAAVIVWNLILR